jgi:hypothetical protein
MVVLAELAVVVLMAVVVVPVVPVEQVARVAPGLLPDSLARGLALAALTAEEELERLALPPLRLPVELRYPLGIRWVRAVELPVRPAWLQATVPRGPEVAALSDLGRSAEEPGGMAQSGIALTGLVAAEGAAPLITAAGSRVELEDRTAVVVAVPATSSPLAAMALRASSSSPTHRPITPRSHPSWIPCRVGQTTSLGLVGPRPTRRRWLVRTHFLARE